MITSKETPCASICNGILMPMLQNKFRILFSHDDSHVLSRQLVSCVINYAKRTATVHIQQPAADMGVHNSIAKMCGKNSATTVYVDTVAGDGNVMCRIALEHMSVNDHEFVLDYAESGVATHIVTFNYVTHTTYTYPEIIQ